MRITWLLILGLFVLEANAQQNLTQSRQSSALTYVYRINAQEAIKLTDKKPRQLSQQYLHTITDSFLTDAAPPFLTAGNYLFVKAVKSVLQYELITIGDLQFKILQNNYDLAVLLHQKDGSVITDAELYRGKRKLTANDATTYYLLKKSKQKGLLRANHNGVVYFANLDNRGPLQYPYYRNRYRKKPWQQIKSSFPVRKIRSWVQQLKNNTHSYANYFANETKHEKKFKGYVAFNKPVYKVGDTVFLKTYITTKTGKPVNRPLLLRLSDNSFVTDTILMTIKPYRPGAYETFFTLNDSLDLILDDSYMLTLEELSSSKYDIDAYDGDLDEDEYAMKRKVLIRGKFEFEEYELKSTKFTARAEKPVSYRGEKNKIYFKATDENGLPVLDGRVDLFIIPREHGINFINNIEFLPDTLFAKTIQLDPVGETSFIIPDSLFPDASFNYTVNCLFLNTNNESRTESVNLSYKNKKEQISFKLQNDSLLISQSISGVPQLKGELVQLIAFNSTDDTILKKRIELPTAIPVNAYAAKYVVVGENTTESFQLTNNNDLIHASAIRTKDSLHITLSNKHQLPAWYSLFAGKKIIRRAVADTTIYLDKTSTKRNYELSLQYVYGDEVHTKNYTVPFADKELIMDIRQPEFIYPGQSADIEIKLRDVNGKPVSDADITAYAYTSKFERVNDPEVPYYGRKYGTRKAKNQFSTSVRAATIYEEPLEWQRWSKELQLDTIEYYKFLHPKGLYYNHQPVPGELTQIAPYIVKDGQLQQIHMLYIDEEPVFFSRSQDLTQYSFAVEPGKHAVRIRTSDALIRVDSIHVYPGKKTIISIDPDNKVPGVSITKQPSKLTAHESALWSKYMILIHSSYGENLVYLRQQNRLVYLRTPEFYNNHSSMLSIGPLKTKAELVVKSVFIQPFEVEPGYQYIVNPGLIKQKQLLLPIIQKDYKLVNGIMPPNFQDLVLTEAALEQIWQQYLFERSRNFDLFPFDHLNRNGNGRLQFSVDKNSKATEDSIKQVILFKNDDPDFIRIYTGVARNLGYLTPGSYRMFLLLASDDYIIHHGLNVKKDGLNFYRITLEDVKKKDSVSANIAKAINNKKRTAYQQATVEMAEVREVFNTAYLDRATFTQQVSGYVYAEDEKPVVGAAVQIRGAAIGTVTDVNGFFALATPENCWLVITSVGYSSTEVKAKPTVVVKLRPLSGNLDEVVVVGYGVQRKLAMTGSVTVVSQLRGLAPGVMVRGVNSVNVAQSPLIILDGVPYDGKLDDLNMSLYGQPTILTADAAVPLYGARAANGAILFQSANKNREPDQPLPDARNSIRRNFRDYAYWQPKVITDKNGSAQFRVTFPDDITNWKTIAIAMGGKKLSGYQVGNIRSFKALSGILSLPNFLTEGDSLNIIAKTQNYLGDTIKVNRVFRINDSIVSQVDLALVNAKIDTFAIAVASTDSLDFSYTIQKPDGYADGESRKLPVIQTGVLEASGLFAALDKDTAFVLTTDPSKGTITIHAETGTIPVILEEIERIHRYEYYCNEQIASKLKALLLQRKIYSKMNTSFKGVNQINELVRRLEKSRNADGLWGWWPNTQPVSWISMHVLEALLLADQAGFKNTLNKQLQIDQLVYQLPHVAASQKLASLRLLRLLDAKFSYEPVLDSLHKHRYGLSTMDQLDLMLMRQQAGLPILLDSAYESRSRTMMGNIYWGEERYHLLRNSIQHTLKIYQLLKASGKYDNALSKIRFYFFEQRRSNSWRNTYESSLIIETLLPELMAEIDPAVKPELTVVTQQGRASDKQTISVFPYELKLPGSTNVNISKTGVAPVYFTAYQQFWNRNPARVDSLFSVSSVFERNGVVIDTLTAGQAVTMKVTVDVTADGDYVMIEIPIPSACSYDSKPHTRRNNEVHREYFKNKVSIFCSGLSRGKYSFEIPLMPRYTGKFVVNPAKAELMYFPVLFGREGMKNVEVR